MKWEIQTRLELLRHGIVPEGYKITKAGIAPEDWAEMNLGEIYTERKEPGNDSLPLLMVSIHSGVSDGEVDEEDLPKKVKRIEDKSQYKRAATGDLVFNMMRAWQGAIGTVRTEGMVSPAYIVAQPNDMVDPLFMDYYMRTNRMVQTIHRQSYGVTDFRLRLYWDSFAPIQCTLPSLSEQQKIAKILTSQDKVIELKEKRLAEKQRQKKYLMQQLLTGKKRVSGHNDEWKQVSLSNVCSYKASSITASSLENYSGDEIYPIYDARSILRYVDFCESKKPYVSIVKDGAGAGRAALAPPNSSVIGTMGYIYQTDQILLEYLYYCLVNIDFSKYSNGSTIPHVYFKDYGCEKISLPSINEQQCIVSVLSTADKQIDLLLQDLALEKQKKKSLMQLLLPGIVRA